MLLAFLFCMYISLSFLDLSKLWYYFQDGTVNVHTIREGQYLRTLHPIGCVDPQAEVAYLTLSHLGHIAFSASDKVSCW